MARDYIGHGVRARAQALVTLELGPENDLERTQKLLNEVDHERFTRLDRALLAKAKANIVVVMTAEEQDPARQTMRIGRLKTLERLGLATERQHGVLGPGRGTGAETAPTGGACRYLQDDAAGPCRGRH